jgi:pseudouridine synthase
MWQRLQKAIAAAGLASRRRAEELIAQGRVQVNGQTITEMGFPVDPDTQKITVDGKLLVIPDEKRYIALHKPVGYVCTLADPYAKKRVTDLVDLPGVRLVPAGRLDADSEGLILLSNDGDFVYKVTHPSQNLGKTYLATVEGTPSKDAIQKLTKGLLLPGESRLTSPAGAKLVGSGPEANTSIVEMTLHEGRNRQVRRMLYQVGHPVIRLVRKRVGPVLLEPLKPGEWRDLTAKEVAQIRRGGKEAKPESLASKAAQNPKEEPGSMPNHGTVTRRTRKKEVTERPKGKTENETGNRSGTRPRPGQNHGKPAPKRVQVHQNRVNRRVPPRGQHHPPDGGGGEGTG